MTRTVSSESGPVVDATTPKRRAAQRLRNALRLNAVTSALGGAIAAIVPGVLDGILETGMPGWVRVAGLGLVVFALDVAVVAGSRTSWLSRATPFVVIADGAWVIASAATIGLGWYSTPGAAVVGGVAVMVGAFAVTQAQRLCVTRRIGAEHWIDESPPVEVAHSERRIPAPSGTMWSIITDHELYGSLAVNLGTVEATGANGPDLTRTCSNRGGRSWDEACTDWVDGARYEVAVDTSDYPYPLTVMRGSWWVQPVRDGASVVGMDFRYQPDASLRGRVFAVVMQAGFPVVLRRILRGWEREATRRSISANS